MAKDFAKNPNIKVQLDQNYPELKFDEVKRRFEELKEVDIFSGELVDVTDLENQRVKISEAVRELSKKKR